VAIEETGAYRLCWLQYAGDRCGRNRDKACELANALAAKCRSRVEVILDAGQLALLDASTTFIAQMPEFPAESRVRKHSFYIQFFMGRFPACRVAAQKREKT
jgi:hypothetical protein